jgi:archaellum component FlaC
MAKAQARTNVMDEARNRFEDALGNVQRDWKRLQKDAEQRRKQLETRMEREVKRVRTEIENSPLAKRAQELRDKAEERAARFRAELRQSPVGKRAEELREQAQERFAEMLGLVGIASVLDIQKLERRVNTLANELKPKARKTKRAAA